MADGIKMPKVSGKVEQQETKHIKQKAKKIKKSKIPKEKVIDTKNRVIKQNEDDEARVIKQVQDDYIKHPRSSRGGYGNPNNLTHTGGTGNASNLVHKGGKGNVNNLNRKGNPQNLKHTGRTKGSKNKVQHSSDVARVDWSMKLIEYVNNDIFLTWGYHDYSDFLWNAIDIIGQRAVANTIKYAVSKGYMQLDVEWWYKRGSDEILNNDDGSFEIQYGGDWFFQGFYQWYGEYMQSIERTDSTLIQNRMVKLAEQSQKYSERTIGRMLEVPEEWLEW